MLKSPRAGTISPTVHSNKARFRAIFDDAPTGIALVGIDRRLLTVTRAPCEMFGDSEAELVGRTLDRLTHPAR